MIDSPNLTLVGVLVTGLATVAQVLIVVVRGALKRKWVPGIAFDEVKAERDAAIARASTAVDLAKTAVENERKAWLLIHRLIALVPPNLRDGALRELRDLEGS